MTEKELEARVKELEQALAPFHDAVLVAEQAHGKLGELTPKHLAQMRSYPLAMHFIRAREVYRGVG